MGGLLVPSHMLLSSPKCCLIQPPRPRYGDGCCAALYCGPADAHDISRSPQSTWGQGLYAPGSCKLPRKATRTCEYNVTGDSSKCAADGPTCPRDLPQISWASGLIGCVLRLPRNAARYGSTPRYAKRHKEMARRVPVVVSVKPQGR